MRRNFRNTPKSTPDYNSLHLYFFQWLPLAVYIAIGCQHETEWVNFKHNCMNDTPGNSRSVRKLSQLRAYLLRWARWLAIGLGEVQAFFIECLRQYMPTLADTGSLEYLYETK